MQGTWVQPLVQKIPHVTEQLSHVATVRGACVPRAHAL